MKCRITRVIAQGDQKLKWEIFDDWLIWIDQEVAPWTSAPLRIAQVRTDIFQFERNMGLFHNHQKYAEQQKNI